MSQVRSLDFVKVGNLSERYGQVGGRKSNGGKVSQGISSKPVCRFVSFCIGMLEDNIEVRGKFRNLEQDA